MDMIFSQYVSIIQIPYVSFGTDFTHTAAISRSQKPPAIRLRAQGKHNNATRYMVPLSGERIQYADSVVSTDGQSRRGQLRHTVDMVIEQCLRIVMLMHVCFNGVSNRPRYVDSSGIGTYEYVVPGICQQCVYTVPMKHAIFSFIGIEQQRCRILSGW